MNPELVLTLDDAVQEVLGMLTGLDLTYDPMHDRYRAITRQLNRALRSNALEHEWGFYHSVISAGTCTEGADEVWLDDSVRTRIVGDDAVRLVDVDGRVTAWAYFLPRDALHKYGTRPGGLWCSVTRNTITFSRPFYGSEEGWDIQVPVMREPVMFRLPEQPEDPNDPLVPVPADVREQPLDFQYPDVVILRAAFYFAQSDPVMQPRVQTIEAQYKDLMYQIIERDDRNTDSPYQNDFFVPVQNSISGQELAHLHPHSDERRR
jgi:hypothetical protein